MTVALPIVYEQPAAEPSNDEPMRRREQVAVLLAAGKSQRDIQVELGLSRTRVSELINRPSRAARARKVRARTISVKRITKRELAVLRAEFPDAGRYKRPKTRAECVNGIRPCPFVGCAHHLYLDVSPITGAIKQNFPDIEPDQMAETCVLDVAEGRGHEVEPEPDPSPAAEDDEEPAAQLQAMTTVFAANTLENVARVMNITRERVRKIEQVALRKLSLVADRSPLAAYRDHVPTGRLAAFVPHQLPIVRRDLKPDNVSFSRAAAPAPKPTTVTSRSEGSPSGAGAVAPDDEPTKRGAMGRCKRPGCERILRGPRPGKVVKPGQEEWCAMCRLGCRPFQEHGPEADGAPPASAPAEPPPAPAPAPAPLASTSAKLAAITLADLLEAHRLVGIIGVERARELANQIEEGR